MNRSNSKIVETGLSLAGVAISTNLNDDELQLLQLKNFIINSSKLGVNENEIFNNSNNVKYANNLPTDLQIDHWFKLLIDSDNFFLNYFDINNQGINTINFNNFSKKRKWELILKNINLLLDENELNLIKDQDDNMLTIDRDSLSKAKDNRDNIVKVKLDKEKLDILHFLESHDKTLQTDKMRVILLKQFLLKLEKQLRKFENCIWFLQDGENLNNLIKLINSFSETNSYYAFLRCIWLLSNENVSIILNAPNFDKLLKFVIKIIKLDNFKLIKDKLLSTKILNCWINPETVDKIWNLFVEDIDQLINQLIYLISNDNPDGNISDEQNDEDQEKHTKQVLTTYQLLTLYGSIHEYFLNFLKLIKAIIENTVSINHKYAIMKILRHNKVHKLFYVIETKIINNTTNLNFDLNLITMELQSIKALEKDIISKINSKQLSLYQPVKENNKTNNNIKITNNKLISTNNKNAANNNSKNNITNIPDTSSLQIFDNFSFGKIFQLLIESSLDTPLEDSLTEMFNNILKIMEMSTYMESINLFNCVNSLIRYFIDKLDANQLKKANSPTNHEDDTSKPLFQDSLDQLIDSLQSDEISRRAMDQLNELQEENEELKSQMERLQNANVKNKSTMNIFDELKQVNSLLDEKDVELERLTLENKKLEEKLSTKTKKLEQIETHQRFNSNKSIMTLPQKFSKSKSTTVFDNIYSPDRKFFSENLNNSNSNNSISNMNRSAALSRKSSIRSSRRINSLASYLQSDSTNSNSSPSHKSNIESNNIPYLNSSNNNSTNILNITKQRSNSSLLQDDLSPYKMPSLNLALNRSSHNINNVGSNPLTYPNSNGMLSHSTSSLLSKDSIESAIVNPFNNSTSGMFNSASPYAPTMPNAFSSISLVQNDIGNITEETITITSKVSNTTTVNGNSAPPPPPPPIPESLSSSVNKATDSILGGSFLPPPPPPLPEILSVSPINDINVATGGPIPPPPPPLPQNLKSNSSTETLTSGAPPPPPPPLPGNFSTSSLVGSNDITPTNGTAPPPPPPPPLPLGLPSNNNSSTDTITQGSEVSTPLSVVPPPFPTLLKINKPIPNKPVIKLKQIHWDRIENVEGTIWQKFSKREITFNDLKNDGVVEEVNSNFKVKEVKLKKKQTEPESANLNQPVSFLSRDLQQQFGINLHMFSNLTVDEFVMKVLNCDNDVVNNISVLEFFNKEELAEITPSLIKKYKPYEQKFGFGDDKEDASELKLRPLERSDELFLKLCYQLRSYWHARSRSLLVITTYEKDYYDLIYKLQKIDAAILKLKNSDNLKNLFYIIIEIGNYMNKNPAQGIKISSLNKLSFIKSSIDNNFSFLHFIEKIVRYHYTDIYTFTQELQSIAELGKLNIDQIELDCQEFNKRVSSMVMDVTKGKLSKPKNLHSRDQVLKKIKYKSTRAKSKNDMLQDHLKLTINDMNKLVKYYGEDISDKDCRTNFFNQFMDFLNNFKKCAKENMEQEAMDKLNEERERKMEEMRSRQLEIENSLKNGGNDDNTEVDNENDGGDEVGPSMNQLLNKLRNQPINKRKAKELKLEEVSPKSYDKGIDTDTDMDNNEERDKDDKDTSSKVISKASPKLLSRVQTMLNDIQNI